MGFELGILLGHPTISPINTSLVQKTELSHPIFDSFLQFE